MMLCWLMNLGFAGGGVVVSPVGIVWLRRRRRM